MEASIIQQHYLVVPSGCTSDTSPVYFYMAVDFVSFLSSEGLGGGISKNEQFARTSKLSQRSL